MDSLPQLMNFIFLGKTILADNMEFELFFGPSTHQVNGASGSFKGLFEVLAQGGAAGADARLPRRGAKPGKLPARRRRGDLWGAAGLGGCAPVFSLRRMALGDVGLLGAVQVLALCFSELRVAFCCCGFLGCFVDGL